MSYRTNRKTGNVFRTKVLGQSILGPGESATSIPKFSREELIELAREYNQANTFGPDRDQSKLAQISVAVYRSGQKTFFDSLVHDIYLARDY